MAWSVFARITGELGETGYSGFLALHNYNEPLLNPRLDQELARIASAMPKSQETPAAHATAAQFTGLAHPGPPSWRAPYHPHSSTGIRLSQTPGTLAS
jgi:hypothetical protein